MPTITISKPRKLRVWNKGQITIPKLFREDLGIADEAILNIAKVGNAIILTTKELTYPKLAREFRSIMKEKGLSERDLLKELKNVRKAIYREEYGSQRS